MENCIREAHLVLICVFRKVTDLQKAINKQIIKAIYPVYIKTLHNRSVDTIQRDIPTVLAYLYTTYGTIETEVLREHKVEVREMVYNLMELLVTIYDEIEELEHLGVAAVDPYSISQIMSHGLTIIKNTNNFKTGIRM